MFGNDGVPEQALAEIAFRVQKSFRMEPKNPACGLKVQLKTVTKLIAILYIVASIVVAASGIYFFILLSPGQRGGVWVEGQDGEFETIETPAKKPTFRDLDLTPRAMPPPSNANQTVEADEPEEIPSSTNNETITVSSKPTSGKGRMIPALFPFWGNLLLMLGVLVGIMVLLMASIALFKGARDGSKQKCRGWLAVNLLLFLLVAGAFGFLCFEEGVSWIILGGILFCEIIHGYFIFLVHAFTQQM